MIPISLLATLVCLGAGLCAARLAQITRSMVLRRILAVAAFALLVIGCASALRLM